MKIYSYILFKIVLELSGNNYDIICYIDLSIHKFWKVLKSPLRFH